MCSKIQIQVLFGNKTIRWEHVLLQKGKIYKNTKIFCFKIQIKKRKVKLLNNLWQHKYGFHTMVRIVLLDSLMWTPKK